MSSSSMDASFSTTIKRKSPESSPPDAHDYQVYLCFRGPDTQFDFTEVLRQHMDSVGIRVFCDAKISLGQQIKEFLLQTIENSEICVPILSVNFPSNLWCLWEVEKMIELKKKVIPIFYKVSVDDVKLKTDLYKTAMQQHETKHGKVQVEKWKSALKKIAQIKGIMVSGKTRHQGQLVKFFTSEVLRLLRDPAPDLVSNNLVGLDSRLENIMGKLDLGSNDVKMVGIHGMGGIGKTTLTDVVYNRISHNFEGSCFLRNVRDTSSRHGFKHLQSQLINEILEDEHPYVVNARDDVKHLLQHRLRNNKVLIVLDDVDAAEQIVELAGNLDWFGKGSRIIVTTRNRAVLPNVEEYEVKELDQHDAFLLFCKNAFKQDLPPAPNELVSLSRQITEATGGLPLSIETIGSYLFTENISVWRGALDRLKREPEVQDRLIISYNILDDKQKQMFLDMACFFVGSNVTLPTHMWRSCHLLSQAGAEVLSLMSMIKIGDDKKIWVHDHFIDLAKEIVLRESISKREDTSRLWGLDARTLIINKQVSRKVEGIRLDCEVGSEPYVIPVETLEELVNLRYLDLGNAILDGNFQGILRRLLGCLGIFDRPLSNLRWLGWHGDTEFNTPPNISVKNLVVLDLSKSTVKETWTGWSLLKEAKKLEVVDLTACHRLKETPDFSSFPCIQRLIFRDCINLEMIHPSVGDLTNLISFDVRNCQGLRSLPMNLGCLEQLHELLLDESSIEAIPDISGLKSLEIFSAKSCKLLRRVPQSVGSLVKLRKLLLDNCESLVEISKTIGQLDLLQELSLSHTRVMDLPDPVVGKWSNLEVLNVDHCPVSSLPSSLGNLPKIQVMNFSGCLNLKGEFLFALEHLTTLRVLKLDHTNISSLPTTICMLSRLHTLDLEGCMKLQSLPSLPVSLVNLKVVVASSVAIPNPTELIKLEHIELQRHSSFAISEDPKHKETPSSDHVQIEYDHEVFLSFRGPDTRKNITNILYEMLTREDITTFIDSEDLHVGEKIDTLLEHINHSKISIPIISKDYASSKWCLKEAAEIVKCVKDGRQKLYPIFYDVDPDEVKHQTGNYAKAFEKHVDSGEFDAQTIQEWRDALREIESRKWLQLKVSTDHNSYIGTELRKVVSDIMNMLEKSPQLKVVDDLIGIEDPVAEITRKLDGDANNVKMLGIWGIAGIGKTTIAKSIFNRFAGQFKGHSSLENVRGTSLESGSLQSFKRQLLFDISKHKMDLAGTGSSSGMCALEARLKGKQLLILIDDVDTREQLDYLVGERDWFGMGSIIIVTTRQEEVLLDSRVVWSNYEVRPMNPHNAFCLFCKHAFHQETANVGFGNLSWDIVEATGRHPLALETIGRYLHSVNDVKVWQGATNILSTKKEIRDKLKISYDALSLAEQQIFLDIACFFQGTDKRMPMHMWNAQNFRADNAMVTLLRRGLVKIRDGSILWMHDLFIELGHEIVRQESGLILRNQTRLWSSEDTLKVLKRKMGTEKVKAIHLDCGSASGNCCFSHENFRNLSTLEFLRLGDANLDHNSNFEGCLSSLIWFSWQRRNLLDIPSGLHLDNLIVLDLSKSLVEDGWNGWNCIKEARNLQVLNLTDCHQLLKTPDLSSFPDMERLILQDCQGLVEIDSSIGNLNSLKFLDVRNCQMLKRLPQELSGLLELKELLLDGSSIQNLPLSSDMKKLEIISAISCRSLTDLSPAIWEQQSLKVLNFSSSGVVYIPDSVEGLTNLVELNIDHCLIGKLPQSLWKLRQLQVLNASGCRNLKGAIPPHLGSLKGLKVLRLDRTGVTSIPESISDLSLLHTLDLKDCMELQSLPTLPSSLTELKLL